MEPTGQPGFAMVCSAIIGAMLEMVSGCCDENEENQFGQVARHNL
jgi:hypothetical protein